MCKVSFGLTYSSWLTLTSLSALTGGPAVVDDVVKLDIIQCQVRMEYVREVEGGGIPATQTIDDRKKREELRSNSSLGRKCFVGRGDL